MRNYVIINGVNSLDIQGLAINNLPPITKPMIRTQREEIDGRDGDIVTELGYSAYDKQMEIGLYGNFDIDAIIKYFTGEGTIVFSNEADKYYNFKILDQIDYEKLLKFKTAVVTFHCQPFKYPLEEEPVEAEITTITGTGETITLEDVEEAPMKIVYKGNTYQNGEPTPDTPIPIQVVSGDNSIEICGKNLLNINNWVKGRINNSTGNIEYASNVSSMVIGENDISFVVSQAWNSGIASDFIPISTGNYCFKYFHNREISMYIDTYDKQKTRISRVVSYTDSASPTTRTFTISDSNVKYIRIHFEVNTANVEYKVSDMQLEKGSQATTYEPYQSQTYPINLPEGMELCKIGDYQDKIDKSTGKNLLDLNRTLGTPSDTDYINTTKRTFDFNKFVAGITGNNYYLPTNISSYEVANNSVKLTATGGGYGLGFPLKVKASQNYKLSYSISASGSETTSVSFYQSDGTFISESRALGTHNYIDITTPSNCDFMVIVFRPPTNTETTYSNIMLNEGSTALPYEPYGTGWYLKKEIGKVVLNGTENWNSGAFGTNSYYYIASNMLQPTDTSPSYVYANLFKGVAYKDKATAGNNIVYTDMSLGLYIRNTSYASLSDFKTMLGTTNLIAYYVLATPTYTLIEGELLNQLEAIKMSYEGQTNISQTNNDLPFELDASVTFLTPMEINNIGNIYAKPILTIEGTGNIDVILNGIQILEIDLSNNGKITIDVPNLQAYNPDNDVLLNRNVTGDYMKLLINDGDNTIAFSGSVTSATLTNYTRWI